MTAPPLSGPEQSRTVSRRGLLLGGGAFAGGAIASGAIVSALQGATSVTASAQPTTASQSRSPSPYGAHQAGIARPGTPQPHGLVRVFDLAVVDRDTISAALRSVQNVIERATDTPLHDPELFADGPGDLTVTVGIGPRLVRSLHPSTPGADDMPTFQGDDGIEPTMIGGDLFVAAYGSDPGQLDAVFAAIDNAVGDGGPIGSVRYTQRVYRGPGSGTIVRNPLGFHDGIVVPEGADELDENVWISDGPAQGGTICVVRRLRLARAEFGSLDVSEREAIVGRKQASGAPMSGGRLHDEADLGAKTPEGEFLIPLRSHVRAAHPTFTGSALMLRRGYAFDNGVAAGGTDGVADAGLMFICFQNELDVFTRTQRRLDEVDALMAFATPTASGTFLILPGFDSDRALGASLLG
ncbi:dye decolorizing peroxidase [Labedella gwakjiensis]|uniref:Dye decolorizing peroxidase n=1 Tax=Labedella gwakjiensis TaxID=390269 RepID=A0A2P8GSP7_9MICO|nr:Dyp-type peroxidase [Labedella gwakjiensis]PSL36975.1 dye decolorizing peroxidase [Labedella gwakjiensis]RUQ81628.1 Dyp-type peroxidase [Labedella gwakjiensis]